MYTKSGITRTNAFLAFIAVIALTLFTAQSITQNSSAQTQQALPPQQKQVLNQWEYKTFNIGPNSAERLNNEIPELQWEFIGATDGYAIFRRPIKVIK